MPDQDDSLLARLNALKPSSVTLDTAPAIDVEIHNPQTRDHKLSERLKRLRDGEDITSRVNAPGVLSAVDRNDLQPHKWETDDEEHSIDDLLAELASNEQAQMKPDDPEDIRRLIDEARTALPPNEQKSHLQDTPDNDGSTNEDGADQDELDGQEADQYIQQVLAELEVERKHAPVEAAPTTQVDEGLPPVPSEIPDTTPPSYEDSELQVRFSKLAMGLPSAPSAAPISKKTKPVTKARSKLPTYTDEDIDSWCCICNEDGELRCIGCDGDVYCQNCWDEGHGSDPGQEQGHKAVLYVRKGGGLAAAD